MPLQRPVQEGSQQQLLCPCPRPRYTRRLGQTLNLRLFTLSSKLVHLVLNVRFSLQVMEAEMPGGGLSVEVRNRVGEGQRNEGCGAEWVQKVRQRIESCVNIVCEGSGMKCFYQVGDILPGGVWKTL